MYSIYKNIAQNESIDLYTNSKPSHYLPWSEAYSEMKDCNQSINSLILENKISEMYTVAKKQSTFFTIYHFILI